MHLKALRTKHFGGQNGEDDVGGQGGGGEGPGTQVAELKSQIQDLFLGSTKFLLLALFIGLGRGGPWGGARVPTLGNNTHVGAVNAYCV